MKKPYVFISYSTKDAETANLVHSYLEGNGISCWIASQNIEGGESFAEKIYDAIIDCDVFVMIFSKNSDDSRHVGSELNIAFSNDKKIIPLRIANYEVSKRRAYYFQQVQWIDAFDNMNLALKRTLSIIQHEIFGNEPTVKDEPIKKINEKAKKKSSSKEESKEVIDDLPNMTREEIVNALLSKIEKFPYCLRDRAYGEKHEEFKKLAKVLFDHTLSMYFKGRPTAKGIDFVDIIVDTLSQGQGVSIEVNGLPGCAKNMLLQLAYYKMLESFKNGECNYLPCYISSSFYEKKKYSDTDPRADMTNVLREEMKEFFSFVKKNPETKPVLMIEAVREHMVSAFAPEDVVLELWKEKKFEKFNRIVAIDVKLIKNRQRLKRTIPLIGNVTGNTFCFNPLPITDKSACLEAIRAILNMYIDKYDGLEETIVYNALYRLGFSTIDIFTIRLVATELSLGHSVDDISLVDMYERLAVSDLNGNEEKILQIANELYEYLFNHKHNPKASKYNAVLWSLPHKHNTYLDFMIAYYFCHRVTISDETKDLEFLKIPTNSMQNRFIASHLNGNYHLQKRLLTLILENYSSFDITQKGNATYWLGCLGYTELEEEAKSFLQGEYQRLKPLVKTDNHQTLINRCNHYLFRSVCQSLIAYGNTKILDEYLCLIVINDVANAINRGATVESLDDNCQINLHNDFYTDTDLSYGEQAIRILCSGVESKLNAKKTGYVETDLVSLLTLIQARMHTTPERLQYNLASFAQRAVAFLNEYQQRPRSVVSDKLLYYFQSVKEDFESYIDNTRFDAAFSLYSKLAQMKETKRVQWLNYGIDDPESLAEHTMNAWTMAMLFLPAVSDDAEYNKQEILDMLLVHDMAEAVLGDTDCNLSEPTKELKAQNYIIKKMFLKGTYPEVANLTYYYNIWTGYFVGQNINARIARDINLIQTTNTFFDYFVKHPEKFNLETVNEWRVKGNKLSTDIGYELFDRIISRNPLYRKSIDKLVTASKTGNKDN